MYGRGMVESRDYIVAEHSFRISATESILELLTNYAPFAVQHVASPVFELTVSTQASPSEKGWKHVYTDTSDEDMPRIEVYHALEASSESEGLYRWLFCISMFRESPTVCQIVATEDFRRAELYINTEDVRFAVDNATMLLYAFTTTCQRTLEMHASVIRREGVGYLFLGHSGTGKSTHSRMWLQAFEDAELLNDDNPIVRVWGEEESGYRVVVYGSPWSGKTPCYRNESCPVQAIVKLSQAPENKIQPLRLAEGYAHILSGSSGMKILPEMMDGLYVTISSLLKAVKVYGMDCLPNTDAAQVCYSATR